MDCFASLPMTETERSDTVGGASTACRRAHPFITPTPASASLWPTLPTKGGGIRKSDLSPQAGRGEERSARKQWIASRSLSSGAHSRDPLARNDGDCNRIGCLKK